MDVLSGDLSKKYFEHSMSLLTSPDRWEALSFAQRSHNRLSQAFAMLSSGVCAVYSRLAALAFGFPWILWSILGPDSAAAIARIRATPLCLLDPFSKAFLAIWRDHLHTDHCKAVLIHLALAVEVDIANEERRHAAVRRMVGKSTQTWLPSFADISGSWLLSQFRKLRFAGPGGSMQSEQKAPAQPHVKKKRAPGLYRTFLNTVLPDELGGQPENFQPALRRLAEVSEINGPSLVWCVGSNRRRYVRDKLFLSEYAAPAVGWRV
jgi:hypothetical protein